MIRLRLKTTALSSFVTLILTSHASANVPIWENLWKPVIHPAPAPYGEPMPAFSGYGVPATPYQPAQQTMPPPKPWAETPAYNAPLEAYPPLSLRDYRHLHQPVVQFRQVSYSQTGIQDSLVQRGLQNMEKWLAKKPGYSTRNIPGSSVSYQQLQETVQRLRRWHGPLDPSALSQQFKLHRISSEKSWNKGEFTGYFTIPLEGSRFKTSEYRYPLYRDPGSNWLRSSSHQQILEGRLQNRGLEIAWLADPYDVYIAHLQGSALINFTDGSSTIIGYSSDNGKSFSRISDYMKSRGYRPKNWSNDGIRDWLREHPEKTREVLLSNPRYIFFTENNHAPSTASGLPAIPGHTIAIDDNFIPHGSVILANLPVLDANGERTGGKEWRLLFAQDRGDAIRGPGRFDIYTGIGKAAESISYKLSGDYEAFLLVKK